MRLLLFVLFNLLMCYSYSEKLICETIISTNIFNEQQIINTIDANMEQLKSQLGYPILYI